MANEKHTHGVSRRNFLKGVGTGIAGAYTIPALKTKAENLPAEIKAAIAGKTELSLSVNGRKVRALIDPETTLAEFLRDELKLTGTKVVCNQGECGGCTVILNKQAVYSCHMLALDADGAEIITIEGLMDGEKLGKVQKAFADKDGLQCGFCTPGQIMSAYALLLANPTPTDEEIKVGMSGNLCRCAAYPKIFDSVKAAVENNTKI